MSDIFTNQEKCIILLNYIRKANILEYAKKTPYMSEFFTDLKIM
jgi:hypothetical protein